MSKKYDAITASGSPRRIIGYREFLPGLKLRKKRALLSYLAVPVIDNLGGVKTNRFSNAGIALSWAEVLNELGYTLDIIDWDDADFIPEKEYDLVVFHGGKNFYNIQGRLRNNPVIIYFGTGSYWEFSNKAEDKRLKNFELRHGIKLERDRYIFDSESPVNDAADGLIVLGDPSMRETYPRKYPLVITINNSSYPDEHFNSVTKDYAVARRNFLFFAGSGNIHKGLDLLIDSFKNLKENLYIVTVLDKKVLSVFKNELKLPNIHLIGEVDMRSKQFYDVIDKCAYVILPSCSEGQAGSVVEAMNQGLIPIVSKETRLDARKYGVILEDNTIKNIMATVEKMSSLEPKIVEDLVKKTREAALKEHSPKKFRKDLKTAVRNILNSQ